MNQQSIDPWSARQSYSALPKIVQSSGAMAAVATIMIMPMASAALINLTNDTVFDTVPVPGGVPGTPGTTVVPLSYYTTINNTQVRGTLIDSALLLQGSLGSGSGTYRRLYQVDSKITEDGYNREVTSSEFDEAIANGFDPFVRINQLQAIDGYYHFALDTNENNSAADKWISLTNLRFYVGGTTDPAQLPVTVGDFQTTLGWTKVWDLQANPVDGTRNDVLLNDTLQSGSGVDNFYILLPTTMFASFDQNSYLYLYTEFGTLGTNQAPGGVNYTGFDTSGGFEEWATLTTSGGLTPVPFVEPLPEPSVAGLAALAGLLAFRRRR